jgi:hypothetical protein
VEKYREAEALTDFHTSMYETLKKAIIHKIDIVCLSFSNGELRRGKNLSFNKKVINSPKP